RRLGRLRETPYPFDFPRRRAVGNPLTQDVALLARQAALVDEVAVTRIGEPRRHPPIVDDAQHGASAVAGVLVIDERERRRRVRPMTGDAVLRQNRRDVLRERDRRLGLLRRAPRDRAAFRDGALNAHGLAGEELVERFLQIAARRLLPRHAGLILVVDASTIAQLALAVED